MARIALPSGLRGGLIQTAQDQAIEETSAAAPDLGRRVGVPVMLIASSLIMAFAWLGHLRFEDLPFAVAILFAWAIVLPEYVLNIAALRHGYGTYTGGHMASLRLSSGVVCVALVSRFVLGEPFTPRKLAGFGLMLVAMLLISVGPDEEAP